MKILLVEDEKDLSNSLKEILTLSKYIVTCAYDGQEGLYKAKEYKYDVIIMDVMMPIMNGIEATRKIREANIMTPIIMLTAKSEIDDKVTGLDAGADDYLPKPFQIKELLARLRALTRRSETLINTNTFYDLSLNPNVYLIKNNKSKDKQVYLTKKEFMLIEYLIKNKNRCSSTEDLLNSIWSDESDVDISIVFVFITNIRKKIKSIGSKVEIKSYRGKGYKIEHV